MKPFLTALLIILCCWGLAVCGRLELNDDGNYCRPIHMDAALSEIELNIGHIDLSADHGMVSVELDESFATNRGHISGPGGTTLPVYNILLAIPQNARLRAEVIDDEFKEFAEMRLAPATEEDMEWVQSGITADGFYPPQLFSFDLVGQLRDLTLARLIIFPVQYDANKSVLRIHSRIRIMAEHDGNGQLASENHLSEAYLPIYRSLVFNWNLLESCPVRRGEYWIISHNNFVDGISALADWKRRKGFPVRIISLSDIGTNPSASVIRSYILNLYNSATVKPDYICLVGDVDMSGTNGLTTYTYSNPYGFGTIDSDNFYTFLLGNDYLPDVLIGRISVDYANELSQYMAKHSGYERFPPDGDLNYYRRATVVSGGENNYFFTPRLTKLWCREMMLNHGFVAVDTIFASDIYQPPTSLITNSISRGVAFINYRGYGTPDGWSSPYYTSSNLNGINNAPYFGVMHSIVCGTGDYYDVVSSCFGETWIRMNNKGGPGFIGNTNHDAHTKWTNAIDHGIYWGLFMAGATTLAQSQLMGKMILFMSFPESTAPGGQVELYFNSYNDLGDPELNCWTEPPMGIVVSHPESIGLGPAGIEVTVNSTNGAPVESAYVCLWKDGEIHELKYSDARGKAIFAVSTLVDGQIAVTITGKNIKPYEGTILVSDRPIYCNVSDYSIDDDSIGGTVGDNDGVCNPGELIDISPVIRNYGQNTAAFNVAATISSSDSLISIIQDSSWFGLIAPGDSATPTTPYRMQIGHDITDGYPLSVRIEITADGGHRWTNYLELPVAAPAISVNSYQIIGGNENGLLDPGETVTLKIELANDGHRAMRTSIGILRSSDSLVTILDSIATFGAIDTNSVGDNNTNPFVISLDGGAYNGRLIGFEINLEGIDGVRQTCQTTVNVGNLSSTDPIGPDAYGYYCFDNTDVNYAYHPVYNWIPIDTTGNYVSIYDDEVAVINLPFPVKYYGQTYTRATICDNGFIAMGAGWWPAFLNAPIPSPQCAPAMIAPFWDDLSSGGSQPIRVYYSHDQANGRMIIGWKRVYCNETYQWLTFEIVILNESVWPTLTGDNEIIFQYNTISGVNLNSVGICNQDRTIGIGYLFNNRYASGAATLTNQRAIKFTTGSAYITDLDEKELLPKHMELAQNYPNPFNGSTVIKFGLSEPTIVKLDIYDLLGRNVTTLANGFLNAGWHSFLWDGADGYGKPVAGGIYFYRIQIGESDLVKKMILLK